jgi:hypothetical protein
LELDQQDCLIFDEKDGTEVDDDECLMDYEKGSIFVVGKQWSPSSAGMENCEGSSVGEEEKVNVASDFTFEPDPENVFPLEKKVELEVKLEVKTGYSDTIESETNVIVTKKRPFEADQANCDFNKRAAYEKESLTTNTSKEEHQHRKIYSVCINSVIKIISLFNDQSSAGAANICYTYEYGVPCIYH